MPRQAFRLREANAQTFCNVIKLGASTVDSLLWCSFFFGVCVCVCVFCLLFIYIYIFVSGVLLFLLLGGLCFYTFVGGDSAGGSAANERKKQANQNNSCLSVHTTSWEGTFCRTVVWPCLPPLMMYQYIRGKDEDMYATELLYYKSGSKDPKAFWDSSRLRGSGHWRMMQDLETIRATANTE